MSSSGLLKKYSRIPIHIVEDHNDALYHILRGIGSKHLPFTKNTMIHFDSHPDLLLPSSLESSEIFDLHLLIEKLSIENWILPAAFAGHISTIVWIKPPWSKQMDDGDYTFFIGRLKGTTKIRVSCPMLYFISELLYCNKSELEDSKEINLHVCTLNFENNSGIKSSVAEIIEKNDGSFILDIDLDFFTTMNPFIDMHKNVNMYERLASIYKFDLTSSDLEKVEKFQEKRSKQLEIFRNVFEMAVKKLNKESSLGDVKRLCKGIDDDVIRNELINLIYDLCKKCDDVDWGLIHDAGCTCDDSNRDLPHHLSSNKEISILLDNSQKFLSSLPAPLLITVARSSLDDYCPPNKVDFLQQEMCSYFKRNHDVEIKLHYEE